MRRALIFTDDLLARARAQPLARRTLIEKWALFEGEPRELARAQLERAAALVPLHQRPRMFGPLRADDDVHAMAGAGVLLLAKLLNDHGWSVEYEPEVDGLTPDLRIEKKGTMFVVEVRRVVGPLGLPVAHQRVQAELQALKSRRQAYFSVMQIDGGRSLRGFISFLKRKIAEGLPGPHTYATPGVLVRFELLPEREEEGGVFLGYSPETAICIDDAPAVRSALREKLRKYRFPIIVALQGIHTGDLFEAAEKVLFGTEVFVIPVGPRGATGPARLDRQQDSAVWQNDSDGARIRTRLDAVLPFEVGVGDQGFFLRARLMANPARPSVAGLESFRPMSTLVHADAETMRYTGPEGRYLRDDERVQDYFVPEGST